MQKKRNDTIEKEGERDEFLDGIGQRIKLARVRANLTQKEMASLLSTNQSWIFMVEDGQQNIQLSSLRRIAHILNVSVRDLIPDDAQPEATDGISSDVSETLHKLFSQMINVIFKGLSKAETASAPSNDASSKPKKLKP